MLFEFKKASWILYFSDSKKALWIQTCSLSSEMLSEFENAMWIQTWFPNLNMLSILKHALGWRLLVECSETQLMVHWGESESNSLGCIGWIGINIGNALSWMLCSRLNALDWIVCCFDDLDGEIQSALCIQASSLNSPMLAEFNNDLWVQKCYVNSRILPELKDTLWIQTCYLNSSMLSVECSQLNTLGWMLPVECAWLSAVWWFSEASWVSFGIIY